MIFVFLFILFLVRVLSTAHKMISYLREEQNLENIGESQKPMNFNKIRTHRKYEEQK